VHGHQEGRSFHGYYDQYCFLPLYVFCGDELVTAYLRPSQIDAAKHARALLRLLVRRLGQAWPGVKITIRADSGFCRWRLMRWCDSHGVGYVLGLARNVVLERRATDAITEAERRFRRTGQPQRIFASFAYAAATWDRPRRIIVKAEHNAQGPNPRFLVVNVPGDPRELYEDVYCQRGEMENRIKEQQLDLFAGRTSCHRFLANQFRLLLSAAAYVLVQALRRTALAGTGLARAQVGTIRLRLLKVAARVVVSARRVVFHLADSYPLKELFGSVLERMTARAMPGRAGAG
jgi:DDE family transposase